MRTPDDPRVILLVLAILAVRPALPAQATAPDEPAGATEVEEPVEPEVRTEIDWSGYVKLDAAWDESLIESGNFARWVASPSIVEDHPHFNMTARQTRLGFEFRRATGNAPPIGARVEIDFYGGGGENKNRPQLRHAYLEIPWPRQGLRLVAGQTSDVISPLVPTTLNYTVAWWVGNIGYRRPLVRLTKTIESAAGGATRLTAAISRTIGDDFGSPEPGDSGVDSGVPTVQLAAARSFPGAAGRTATIGISGHWGKERLEETLAQPVPEFDSWSVNLDVLVPLGKETTLKGELWTGENLDDYFGAIGQGINFARDLEIEAMGGWLAVDTRTSARTTMSLGLGTDDPDDDNLGPGDRALNEAVWANWQWDFQRDLRFGVEASWWRTDYVGLDDGSSLRLQTSLIYRFSR